ncbi:hypothetical protein P8452_01602 [Trifolium repens]|nr:hypothetical protein P8452_01602 [Trifolium repens]
MECLRIWKLKVQNVLEASFVESLKPFKSSKSLGIQLETDDYCWIRGKLLLTSFSSIIYTSITNVTTPVLEEINDNIMI